MKKLTQLPLPERPREKLAATGAAALSDSELVALLFGSGGRQRDVSAIARDVVKVVDSRNGNLMQKDLTEIGGVGPVKAAQILAALEFARRRIRPAHWKIRGPADVVPLVQHLASRPQEHFTCTSLNGAHEVITTRIVTVGILNAAQVHPREVFCEAITDRAAAVIVAHNHPSGDLTPSDQDLQVTRRLQAAGRILGIELLDHVIFSVNGYLSLMERGDFEN